MRLLSTIILLTTAVCFIIGYSLQGQNKVQTEMSESQSNDHDHLDHITYQSAMADTGNTEKVERSEAEWKELLDSDEYRILRKKGTEIPWVNEYNSLYDEGVYICRACGNPLFHSETKYNSKSGWPSYWAPIDEDAVAEKEDNSFFMKRTEIVCNRCDSHLGHVFDDGPEPTGLRYCMNSKAMKFIAKDNS